PAGALSPARGGGVFPATPAAAKLFGPGPAPAGARMSELFPDDEPGEALSRFGDEASRWSAVRRVRARRRDGVEFPAEVSFGERRAEGRETLTVVVRDVTARLAAERQIESLAYHDVLTGLPNRALFQDRLGQAISRAQRDGGGVAILFVDLDQFKLINDSLGHSRGDLVLREVGARLQSCLRASDTAARLGGDEFIVCMQPVDDPAAAGRVAGKVLAALARPLPPPAHSPLITGCCRCAMFPA